MGKQINHLLWVLVRKTLENAPLRRARKVTAENTRASLLSLRGVGWPPGDPVAKPEVIST